MSGPLAWDGRSPIAEAPERVELALATSHTLLERDGGYWAALGSRVRDTHGRHGVLAGGPVSSHLATPDIGLLPVSATLDVLHAVLLPAVVQALRAIEAIPDLGWIAVVAGDGVRAELLSGLLLHAGTRRTIRVMPVAGEAAGLLADETIAASALKQEELRGLLRGPTAPVVAFETRGHPDDQLALLDALPAGSHLVLLESVGPEARAAVDFYQSVHRKNTAVYGIPLSDPLDARRCDRALQLLGKPPFDTWRPDVTRVPAQRGRVPGADRLLLLTWSEG